MPDNVLDRSGNSGALGPAARQLRVTYLIKQPLTERDFRRHGIGYFLERGHEVSVFDLSNLFHPDLTNDRTALAQDSRMSYQVIEQWSGLDKAVETLRKSSLVMLLVQGFGLSASVYRVLRRIAKSGTPYLIQYAPTYPGWQGSGTRNGEKKRNPVVWRWPRSPIDSFLTRTPPRFLGIPAAAFVIYSGRDRRRNNLLSPNSVEIRTHAYDYDIFQEMRGNDIAEKEQAVFIDQYLPFHHDHTEQGGISIDADAYYRNLNALFDRIERTLGLRVVIAAHPRADYSRQEPLFEGRITYSGNTPRLVLESRLVIAHYSIATAFAVMAKKPLLVVSSRNIYEALPRQREFCEGLARETGKHVRFIDQDTEIDPAAVMRVDDDLYEKFLSDYTANPDARAFSSWQIIERNIMDFLPETSVE
jgi:hypothetical protein